MLKEILKNIWIQCNIYEIIKRDNSVTTEGNQVMVEASPLYQDTLYFYLLMSILDVLGNSSKLERKTLYYSIL